MAGAGAKKSGLGRQGACGLTAFLFCLRFPPLGAQDTVANLAEICGRSKFTPKIFGGQDAGPERWPWQAALLLNGRFICGAALIDSNWVASAAHCFQRSHNPDDYQILLGYNQLSNPSNYSLQMTLNKVIVHPDYDKKHFLANDITLMQLHRPVTFNSHIRPACLPKSETKPNPMSTCWISGWGMLTEDEFLPPPMQLREAEMGLVDSAACNAFYRPPDAKRPGGKPIGIHEDVLCAGDYIHRRSICRGDSGGPFVCPLEGVWYLFGLTSWSAECHPYRFGPSVFTNLSYFAKWIKQNKKDTPMPDPSKAPPTQKAPALVPPVQAWGLVLKSRVTALLSSQILLLWLILLSAQ